MSQALTLTIRPVNPIREGLNALFRIKKTIIALCVVLPLAAIGIGYLVTPQYEADASLMVKTGREYSLSSQIGEGQPVPPAVTKVEIINSEVEILSSHKLAQDTIDAVGLATIFPDIADSDDTPERKAFLAMEAWSASLKVKPVKLSNVIDVSFRNQDRAVSEKVLTTLLQKYLGQHVDVYSEARSAGFDEALQRYTAQIRDLEAQKTAILVKYDLSAADHLRESIITQQAALADRLHTLRDHAVEASGKVKFYEQQIARTPRMITVQTATSDALEKARSQLVDLRMKEGELAAHFDDQATPLKQVRNDIKVVQQFMARGGRDAHVTTANNPLYDDLALNLSRAQADLTPINEQIAQLEAANDELRDRLHAIEEGSQKLSDVQRQIDMLTAVLTTYRNRLEGARIDEQLDKSRDSSVSVISPPFSPIKPVFPHKSIFAIAGLGLAILISGAIWVYQLLFRSNLSSPESVERLLAIPVLMTVPNLPPAKRESGLFQADGVRPLSER